MSETAIPRFRRLSRLTLASVYVLILVGGIVRGTGAGMGCPDWPRCFDRWVPPTTAADLPADYKETYRQGRIAKNKKVAARLDRMGFHGVAENIFRHPASFIETEFNPTKTWIEYVNRLVGALIGVFIILTFVFSLPLRRRAPRVTLAVGLALVTVGVQGWLGSLVVSTNLMPALVTWHMALALVLLALLHYAASYELSNAEHLTPDLQHPTPNTLRWLAWAFTALVFGQIILGTQVREGIDVVAAQLGYLNRESWIERVGQLGPEFSFHRALSTLLLLAGVGVGYRAWDTGRPDLRRRAAWLGALLVLNPLVGVALATFAVPAALQPAHLVVGTGLFGASVALALAAGRPSTGAASETRRETTRPTSSQATTNGIVIQGD